jgi:hypothetical protein
MSDRGGLSSKQASSPLCLVPPTLEGVTASQTNAAPREWAAGSLVFVCSLTAIVLVLVVNALLQGPWLDEFWTLELAHTRKSIAQLADGWLRDTHPPTFNIWATSLDALGLHSIPLARVASNLPAIAFLIWAAACFSRGRLTDRHYQTLMVLLVLSLPQSVEAFANYRSYFWQIASLASLMAIARHVVATPYDLDWSRDWDLLALSVVAIVGSLGLHYVGAIFGGLLAALIFLYALTHGYRRWAMLLLSTSTATFAVVVFIAVLQTRHWAADLDHSWIEARPVMAVVSVPLVLIMGALLHNVVPLMALWPGWRRWTRPERAFVAMITGVLIGGLALVLIVDAFQPIMVDRYLFAVPVLVCGIMASLATKLDRYPLRLLLTVNAVAVVACPFLLGDTKPQWKEGARLIARIVETCPTTRVYAASGWVLGPAAATRAARREDIVFRRAYTMLAAEHNYTVQFLGQGETARTTVDECPVLIWFEHTPNNAEDDPRAAVTASGLTGIEDAKYFAYRSSTGFVVRVDR